MVYRLSRYYIYLLNYLFENRYVFLLEGNVGFRALGDDFFYVNRRLIGARNLLDAAGVLRLLAGFQARPQRAGCEGKSRV